MKEGSSGKALMHGAVGAGYSHIIGGSARAGFAAGAATEMLSPYLSSRSPSRDPGESILASARGKSAAALIGGLTAFAAGGDASDIDTGSGIAASAIVHNSQAHILLEGLIIGEEVAVAAGVMSSPVISAAVSEVTGKVVAKLESGALAFAGSEASPQFVKALAGAYVAGRALSGMDAAPAITSGAGAAGGARAGIIATPIHESNASSFVTPIHEGRRSVLWSPGVSSDVDRFGRLPGFSRIDPALARLRALEGFHAPPTPDLSILYNSKTLLPGEGRVGTFGELIDQSQKGDNLSAHHIPNSQYMRNYGIDRDDGIAILVEEPVPGSGGRHREIHKKLQVQDPSLTPREALVEGILRAREVYKQDGLYTKEIKESLRDVIKLNKQEFPRLFGKDGVKDE